MQDFPNSLISDIESAFVRHHDIKVVGAQNSVGLASLLTGKSYAFFHKYPQLVIVPSLEAAEDLERAILFFNPSAQIHILESFDISPYSGLFPNSRAAGRRLFWLYRAQYSTGGEIFIAPIKALLQKTMPLSVFDKNTVTLKLNSELSSSFYKQLSLMGYQNVPRVEDVGQFCIKGGLLDLFSPAHENPIRAELFGDYIESLRYFHPESQRTLDLATELVVLPAREAVYLDNSKELMFQFLTELYKKSFFSKEQKEFLYDNISLKRFFHGIDFLFPYFYEETSLVTDYFTHPVCCFFYDPIEIERQADLFLSETKKEEESASEVVAGRSEDLFAKDVFPKLPPNSYTARLSRIELHSYLEEDTGPAVHHKISTPTVHKKDIKEKLHALSSKIKSDVSSGIKIFISTRTLAQAERIRLLLEADDVFSEIHPEDFHVLEGPGSDRVEIVPRPLPESAFFETEKVLFLREEDFFGEKEARSKIRRGEVTQTKNLLLADLKLGDLVVHNEFGVGVYDGLTTMNVQGVESEFVLVKYRDEDRLYVPVYRINLIRKFSGSAPLDKLGHNNWSKVKTKVKNHLKDVTSELLNLYARRAQTTRTPYKSPDVEYAQFEAQFPYEETEDQDQSIRAVLEDLQRPTPMDRLVCGDVGFGKTEVAMRAAFRVAQERKQVAVLVPTTVLSFQHTESFKKRFKDWPLVIENLSRFTETKKAREIIQKLKSGEIDIVIGTHRLLSKDIAFKDLGLLIVDEEHKFGVTHKEKIKKIRTSIDTIAMSATPIPRTLNMSLMGVRDLSIINTAPRDRLPVRTFICKFDEALIKKAIESELQRGGQVFFLHNKVHSIHEMTQTIQGLVPGARVRYGHGQMDEDDLEKTMLGFFNHEFDVLVCTTIIESGIDNPKANTILIHRADTLGLSQLYQLRGRVGRSNERAYCYLLIPQSGAVDPLAQERLRVLQENTDLGSGLRIAHHDLELRGAGNLLGEEQAGHANAVGYELYVELLDQTLREARGENLEKEYLEPEINIKVPAFIPDEFIPDIRTRMSYYFELSKIQSPDDMDRYEEELADQFGRPPEPVLNLMGIMLLKKCCKDLAIRDLSAGLKSISLAFTEHTPLKSEHMIELVTGHPKKYSITPDSRLIVQMQEINWPQIYKELSSLLEEVQ